MKLRPLGSTGIRVSPLGLGTVKLGRDQSVKYPVPFTIPDDRQALALFDAARELGINFIDTAPAYGVSEERLGALLGDRWDGWILGTKVGEEFENGASRFDFSAAHTRFSLERSLRRLRRDTLDLVLVHSDGNDLAVLREGVVDELRAAKERGVIRAWGISTKTVEGGLAALAAGADAVMVTFNLDHAAEVPVIDDARSRGRGVLVKKGLASGHADPAASLHHVLGHAGVSSVIVGTINPHHLAQNVRAAEAAGA